MRSRLETVHPSSALEGIDVTTPPLTSRTRMTARVAALLLLGTAAVAGWWVVTSPHDDSPPPAPHHDAEPPHDANPWRPAVHLAPSSGWMNDVQRPVWADGEWHLYNLVNGDYPEGNGTSWQHATSDDLVHWEPRGTAIEKYHNGLGDVESGSVVVDEHDTAGFGAGTLVAIATQQLDGVQRQSLFYSRDGGDTFTSYDGNPVLDNPGSGDFRDPKVIWDESRRQWVMALAEGDKIGFYSSPDLKTWTYLSDFQRDDLGTLECPDLFPMAVDGDPNRIRWVLAASANGSGYGRSTGYAYWVGDWDGTGFTPDDASPQWLDQGDDFYAAVTWPDSRATAAAQLQQRYAIGWMNNWAYADEVPGVPSKGGFNSLVRSIRLEDVDGRSTLTSRLADDAGQGVEPVTGTTGTVRGTTTLFNTAETSYRLHLRFAATDAREVRVRVRAADGTSMTVGYDARQQHAFLSRDTDAVAGGMPEAYRRIQTGPTAPGPDGTISLDLVMDGGATEAYFDDTGTSFASLVFLGSGTRAIEVEPVDGTTRVEAAELTPLSPDS